MASLSHQCDNCDSKFTIKYDIEKCEDDPHFCPFCSEYILETDETEDEGD